MICMVESEKIDDYVNQITKALRENEQFTKTNISAKNAYDEIVELINDAIDLLGQLPNKSDKFVKSVKYNFILTNLMPSSYSILFNFLAGNIPTCFMQIRTAVEYLVMGFIADKENPSEGFFYEKLQKVEEKRNKEHMRLHQLIKTIDPEAAMLWTNCSEWGHAQSLTKKMIDQITSSDIPGWSLVVPMPYNQTDEQPITELQEATKQLRSALARIIQKWR